MLLFIIKAAVSGLLVALVSTVAQRFPGWGGLLASLPLVSLLAMLWLYGETGDAQRVADLSLGAFWFFLPSVPMFLIIPAMLRREFAFWPTMLTAVLVTMALYALMARIGPRFGISL